MAYQQHHQCKDIRQTLHNIGTHITHLLSQQQQGSSLSDVVKMENPPGAYIFRLINIRQPESTVELIKRSLGESYVQRWADKNYGTIDLVILAERYDQDTYAHATSLYSAYRQDYSSRQRMGVSNNNSMGTSSNYGWPQCGSSDSDSDDELFTSSSHNVRNKSMSDTEDWSRKPRLIQQPQQGITFTQNVTFKVLISVGILFGMFMLYLYLMTSNTIPNTIINDDQKSPLGYNPNE